MATAWEKSWRTIQWARNWNLRWVVSGRGQGMAWRISNGRIDRLVIFKAMGDDHVPIGELTFEGSARVRQGRFVYAGSWLKNPDRTEIDPIGLPLRKKLGRQSLLLEGALFEGGEVGGRIAAEAGAQDPGVVALFQAGSGIAPFGKIDRRQVLGADWGEAGQRRGEDADGAAHDQAWRGDFAAGGAPLMVALGPEELLQVVVGRRQAGNLQVVEQAGAVAVGDLEEAVDGIAQGAAGIPAVAPSVEQAGIARLDVIGRTPGCVLQDAGRGMDPAEAPPDVRPQRAGPIQTLGEQGAKLLQLRWQISPFSSIRPRLASTASKRSCSHKPAASSGGRPSSVRALRTAAQ